VVGDLGTHAYHLARYITGLEAEQVSAQLATFVPGRRVFDHATIALRWAGGVPGRIWASMVATGHNHGLRIRVFGDQGSLEWQHEDPHHLHLQDLAGETRILTHGMSTLSEDSGRLTRVGLGHRDLADILDARRFGRPVAARELSIPTGVDGLLGVQLVEAALVSNSADGAWVAPGRTHLPANDK
jgi:predicted dehydrogenase